MAKHKRLSVHEWAEVEALITKENYTNVAVAKMYGISEGAIRRRFGAKNKKVIEKVAQKVAEARTELAKLPEASQVKALALADIWEEVSISMATSARNGAMTSATLSNIAGFQTEKLDGENPDSEKVKLIHALTETANKAAQQPMDILKANKEMMKANTPTSQVPSGLGAFYGEQ